MKDYLHQQYLSIYELIGFQLKLGFLLFSISKFVRPFTVTEADLSLVTFCYGIFVLFEPFQSSPETVELALKRQHSLLVWCSTISLAKHVTSKKFISGQSVAHWFTDLHILYLVTAPFLVEFPALCCLLLFSFSVCQFLANDLFCILVLVVVVIWI